MAKVKPTEGIAQTVIDNEPDEAPKTATLKSPWGTKVTVDAEQVDVLKDAGYTASGGSKS